MNTKTIHGSYLLLLVLLWQAAWQEGNAQLIYEPGQSLSVSSNLLISIRGQETNTLVLAREVVRGQGSGPDDRALVLFNPASGQAFVTGYTNNVYALKGKFFRVTPDAQSFWIKMSRPVTNSELAMELTTNLLAQSAEDSWPRENPYKRLVDLRPILRSEADLGLAQILGLHNVELTVEGDRLVANFESYTHLKGKVVLDDQLNVVSMVLTNGLKNEPSFDEGRNH